jgi:hypothetical protein
MGTEETKQTVARRYQWYTGYEQDDEYEKNPQWAVDMRSDVVEDDSENANVFGGDTVKVYDKYDPEHMWIKSDVTRDLTNML